MSFMKNAPIIPTTNRSRPIPQRSLSRRQTICGIAGWQWGLPAYLAAGFVGYSRVEAKQHHWWDVAASAGIAFAYSRFVVTPFRRYNIDASVYAMPNSVYLGMCYQF
jgi:membrane-associated phospholipid phosphatase